MNLEKELLRNLNGKRLNDMKNYELRNLIHYKLHNNFYCEGERVMEFFNHKIADSTALYRFYK